jgi:hypothetical protein
MGYKAAAAPMFDHILSIAAFGFLAFVLVFVHPASQASRQATPQKTAQQAAQAAGLPLQMLLPPLCARALPHRNDCITHSS